MFNAFDQSKKFSSKNRPPSEGKQKIESFQRGLADARKGLTSKEEASKMQEIANSVLPQKRYEEFMRRNLGNQRRIDSFKGAIDRRIQKKFKIEERRAKLKKMLQIEDRRKI